ncbi:MAG: methyl-accepting chemotaxis protein [Betaproteobacteria bacterium]
MITLEKMRVSTRLIVAGAAVVLGLSFLTGFTLIQIKRDALAAHNERIKDLVEASKGIVGNYLKLESDKKLSREEAQFQAKEALRTLRFGANDYYFLYDFEGRALMVAGNPKIEGQVLLGKTDAGGFKLWEAIVEKGKAGQGYFDYVFPRAGQTESKPKRGYVIGIPEWQWIVGTGVYVDDVDEAVKKAALSYGLISLLILVAVTLISFLVSRSIVKQLGGEPATAIELMSRAAAGDLTVEVHSSSSGSILDSAGQMVHSIRQMVTEITQSSSQLTRGAEHISTASNEVAIASQRQSDATSSMAAAIEEMTVSINHISDSAKDTQDNSLSSVALSEDGFSRIQTASKEINAISSSVNDASERIRKLEERANQISSIAGVIKDIAGQTNLLALNAAIEAARAGEQGRGFAVVADEVRKLAERTSLATIEIEKMIAGIQTDTVEVVGVMDAALPQVTAGVQAAEAAANTLRQIKDGAQITLERIREVADSTKEQSIASDSIAQKVEEIASMVEETTAAMKSNAETASAMEKIASELTLLVSRFRC